MNKNMGYQQVTPEIIVSSKLKSGLGIAPHEELGCYELDKVLLLHKEEMTGLEKLGLAGSLVGYAAALIEEAADEGRACGGCVCDENCSCGERRDEDKIRIPFDLLQKAGIPADVPLAAEVRQDGSIVIRSEEDDRETDAAAPGLIELMCSILQDVFCAISNPEAEGNGG